VASLPGSVDEPCPGVEHGEVVGHHRITCSQGEVQDQVAAVGRSVQQF